MARANADTALTHDDLVKLQAAAASFYEDAERGDWQQAAKHLQQVGKAAGQAMLGTDPEDARLSNAVIRCVRAVHGRDQPAALHAANKIREWAARTLHPERPSELPHLGYLVRETQIEAGCNRPAKLVARVEEARQCWERLKPLLEKSRDPAMVQDGDAAIRSLEQAQTSDALEQAQAACLQVFERLEQATVIPPR